MDLLIAYAMTFVGTPYKYAGNNPLQGGMDCSGFVGEVLRFSGLVGNKEDLTAQELYDRFESSGSLGSRSAGSLAFYGKSVTQITHVAFMVDQYRILEAGGGQSSTVSIEDAAAKNAMVRGRLVNYRQDLVATVKPRYALIGMY